MKKVLRCFWYTIRDCHRAFPAFYGILFLLYTLDVAAEVAGPLLMASILELAGEGGAGAGAITGAFLTYGLCLVVPPVTGVLLRACFKTAQVRGQKYFGGLLFAFSRKIRLEALEDPEVLNKFYSADKGGAEQFQFMDRLIMVVRCLLICIGTVIVVGRYSPILVFTGLIEIFPDIFTKLYFEKRLADFRRSYRTVSRRCDYFLKLFTGKESVKEMRVMGFDRYLEEKWVGENLRKVRELKGVNLDICRQQVLGIAVINACYAFNIGLSFYLMVQGRISVGAFAACLSAFSILHNNLGGVVGCAANVAQKYYVVEEYYDYFTIPVEKNGSEPYRPFREKIVAEDVYFRYSGSDRDALSGLCCEIRKGEHVVIVGENGSGKTTFSKLLSGVYLPSGGRISYDGQGTEDMERRSLYDHISVVLQDFVRYHFTLRENISLGSAKTAAAADTEEGMGITGTSDAEEGIGAAGTADTAETAVPIKYFETMEELLCQVAGTEFLQKTGGLDAQMGREFGGVELSGGEWQKIAIARGLWKDSDIIILDEPASALDPLVEYDILTKFVEMIQGRTSVIISHRVGICRNADKIIVMKNGRVAECGRHEELLRAGGEYAHIWQEQAKWYV